MRTRFTKMHGNGNDFVLIDGASGGGDLSAETVRRLADRRVGIGCDQILVVRPPLRPPADVRMQIFNADGSEVEQCGNGVRCMATFLRERGLVTRDEITIETGGRHVTAKILPDGAVQVNMGEPIFEPSAVPFLIDERADSYALTIKDVKFEFGVTALGNPHAVLQVADIDAVPVADLGSIIQADARFPAGVNVGFAQKISRHQIRLRVFERGVGETLACGSGACAAVVVGCLQGLLDERVQVDLPGGCLHVEWRGPGHPVWMTGPTQHVFHGEVEL